MTTSNTGDSQKQIYENLISIAQLHWSHEAIEKMIPQINQTASNLDQIIQDIPESDIEPLWAGHDSVIRYVIGWL